VYVEYILQVIITEIERRADFEGNARVGYYSGWLTDIISFLIKFQHTRTQTLLVVVVEVVVLVVVVLVVVVLVVVVLVVLVVAAVK
jgi:hypothetical protein